MKRWIDDTKVMYTCRQCKHNLLDGVMCKAFDIVPMKFVKNALLHKSVVKGQKGSYVFESNGEPPEVCRDYHFSEN